MRSHRLGQFLWLFFLQMVPLNAVTLCIASARLHQRLGASECKLVQTLSIPEAVMIVHRVSACGVEYACSLRRAASYEIRGQKLAVALIRDSTPGRGVNE